MRGTIDERFRETEIHLALDKDRSDPRVLRKMLDAGLYGAYLPKGEHTGLILTAQGFKRDIVPLRNALETYLHKAGGVARATLKEERAIAHKLIGITPHELPEIVDRVTYFS